MENKTTTELLELLRKLPDNGDETWGSGGKYTKIIDELKTRYPFQDLLDEDWENSLPDLINQIKELKDEIKKLRRHKHDEKNGDVLIRI